MNAAMLLRRFLVPRPVASLWYAVRRRAWVSPRAEVEVGGLLRLGRGTRVASYTKIKASAGPVEIGANCGIATGCMLAAGAGGLRIGDETRIGPNVTIIASSYRYSDPDVPLRLQGQQSEGIRIGENVWIGAGSVILDGARIGDGAIISANTVVRGEVPSRTMAFGTPKDLSLVPLHDGVARTS